MALLAMPCPGNSYAAEATASPRRLMHMMTAPALPTTAAGRFESPCAFLADHSTTMSLESANIFVYLDTKRYAMICLYCTWREKKRRHTRARWAYRKLIGRVDTKAEPPVATGSPRSFQIAPWQMVLFAITSSI